MRITIVVPRYGDGVIGGAETLARRVAGLLAERHSVTVATTTARDYQTWNNALPAGADRDGPIRVLRFPVLRPRDAYWIALDRLLLGMRHADEFAVLSGTAKRALQRRLERWPLALQEEYVRWQGPHVPELLDWLTQHGHDQDRVLFFTYLYPTTYFGMARVASEQIDLVPTLHDEPVAYLPVYGECFRRADRVLFSTLAECRLARQLYGVGAGRDHVVGCGTEEPETGSAPEIGPDPFLLYVGRIDVNKGVPELVRDFIRFKAAQPRSRLRLLLVGDAHVELPRHPAVEPRGPVSEAEKLGLMRRALALVHPSPFESLALVLLEAFWCATPGLVYGRNAVLVQHCRSSNGGLWYGDYDEFAAALNWLESHADEARELGRQAREYVRREYSLNAYRQRLAALYPG